MPYHPAEGVGTLAYYGYSMQDMWWCWTALGCFGFLFRLVAYLALVIRERINL